MKTNRHKLNPNGMLAEAVRKIASDKALLLECVRQNIPLSTLKEKGVVLPKLG